MPQFGKKDWEARALSVVVAMEVRKRRIRAHLLLQQERRVKTAKDLEKVKVAAAVVVGAGEEVARRNVKKDNKSKYSIAVSTGLNLPNQKKKQKKKRKGCPLFHVA